MKKIYAAMSLKEKIEVQKKKIQKQEAIKKDYFDWLTGELTDAEISFNREGFCVKIPDLSVTIKSNENGQGFRLYSGETPVKDVNKHNTLHAIAEMIAQG